MLSPPSAPAEPSASRRPFRIGTRGSAMALAQTEAVMAALAAAHPDLAPEPALREPRGDRDLVSRLDRHGGKGGAFVAEIRAAVLEGRMDAAMHSLKDVPGNEEVPELVLAAFMVRDDPRDALVLRRNGQGGVAERDVRVIGTNSVRRAALLPPLYPEARVVHYRGAADTRIAKLDRGEGQALPGGGRAEPADALVLAASGLRRVGLGHRIARLFEPNEMLPAAGQGIVVVECRADDWDTRRRLQAIDDGAARTAATAEREVLWVLDGHCNSPIAAHATVRDGTIGLEAAVMGPGGAIVRARGEGPLPREVGRRVAFDLLRQGAGAMIAATAPDVP